MTLNNKALNQKFEVLFKVFEEKYDELAKLRTKMITPIREKGEKEIERIKSLKSEDSNLKEVLEVKRAFYKEKERKIIDKITPKSLRLFRVRLLLVIGMKIDFDTNYSLTNDKDVKDTYVQIIKCSEAWFAYEGLVKVTDETDKIASQKFTQISQDTFENKYLTSDILKIYNDELLNWIQLGRLGKRKDSVKNYMNDLSGQMFSSAETLKIHLESFGHKIDIGSDVNDFNVLAMIYATRNVFVHKGESAFFGQINYQNKSELLKLSYDYIILLMLKAIIYYSDKQLDKKYE